MDFLSFIVWIVLWVSMCYFGGELINKALSIHLDMGQYSLIFFGVYIFTHFMNWVCFGVIR
jgi:membrane protein DedA with SNARE-associated domain